ncbi:MAG TPA: FAD-binding protein [Feifaniaceae bacterium]|nr:FAD-binding protein [Feifaniaceae bacterium]
MRNSIRPFVCLLLTILMVAGCSPTVPQAAPDVSPEATQAPAAAPAAFEDTINWDGEYDVVVVGYGAAGAVASITAADAGAKVLMLEKAPMGKEGGNSKYAAQIILAPTDREKAITYFKAMRGGYDNQTDTIIETIVDGSMQNRDWLTGMGAASLTDVPLIEYPELPGSDGISTVIIEGKMWTSRFWQLLQENVDKRGDNIDIWFESPGTELIQDPATKIIHGVKVERGGKTLSVRAKNGVVLACGGFENNEDMVENYTQMQYCYSKGAVYNTGDGIKMAMRVGADLWHMSALSGPDVNFKDPNMDIAFGYGVQWPSATGNITGFFGSNSAFFIGSDGTRFVNEAESPRHGHIDNHGTWISMPIPQPAYMIFDEAARLSGPIYGSWSADNSEELAKGYFVQAETIEELAAKISVDPAALKAQVEQYNSFCKNGEDIIFRRDPATMKPIAAGPYYAMELSPSFTNTQGGPKRNEHAEVLDVDGNAIPHLYSAGELGSYYADIYNGGGNLSECIFSGREAGTNAAAAKQDISARSVMEGKTPAVPVADNKQQSAAPEGVLVGEGSGIGGKLVVHVKMDADKIASVEVVSQSETEGIADKALEQIPAAIVAAQSTEVDAVSGATVTSEAIKAAVADALSKK